MKIYGKLEEAQLEPLLTEPTNKPLARTWFDKTNNRVKVKHNSTTEGIATLTDLDNLSTNLTTAFTSGSGTLTNKTLINPTISNPTGITKADIGLSAVDNTSDSTKNSAIATLTNKTLVSPVITSPTGITKVDVGLSNVDNTSDATKNSSIATLTNKTLVSPVITSPTGLTKADVGLGNVDNTSDATKNSAIATLTNKTLTTPVINSPTGLVKADVGLSNVDNTSDATKNSAVANLSNKTFSNKTLFNAEIVGASSDTSTAGSSQVIAAPQTLVVNLTGALTSLSGIAAVTGAQPVILVNKSGADITINNEDSSVTASARIITGTANNLSFMNTSSLWLIYDLTSARWRIVGGSGSGGGGSTKSVSSLLAISNGSAISINSLIGSQSFVVGSSAPVTLAALPFASTAPVNGSNITLIGYSDTNTVTIPGSDVAKGVLGYDITLGRGQTVTYEYNSTLDRYIILSTSN